MVFRLCVGEDVGQLLCVVDEGVVVVDKDPFRAATVVVNEFVNHKSFKRKIAVTVGEAAYNDVVVFLLFISENNTLYLGCCQLENEILKKG